MSRLFGPSGIELLEEFGAAVRAATPQDALSRRSFDRRMPQAVRRPPGRTDISSAVASATERERSHGPEQGLSDTRLGEFRSMVVSAAFRA